MEVFIFLLAALFSVLNPIGTVPIFVGLTQGYSKKERSRVAILTAINVFIILIISFFVGQYVLTFFGITIPALRIAGGIIIASSGFSLLNGKFSKNKGINKKVEEEIQRRNDIALTPLAMPMLAGPGSISLLIAYYQEHHSTSDILFSSLSILTVAFSIFLILRSAHYLAKMLGSSGIIAISRIIGFLTIAIGIQYIISSIISIANEHFMK
ncbi:MarC family NAAT transporter [Flavobacterium sp. SUN046]|jgi:MarC family membrane protein|uniref:MarC family NAAT transporter n=1 Tax=Flavobacterium sp. SUN046 TaxID=3002440 RepID=UPI002DB5E511|nr:MarC family NAAT transporter [Flavobacterium sp. SUN046]MEC4050868.1 MarC family NAAT transporter [Flavobacterium sp. SUN046]